MGELAHSGTLRGKLAAFATRQLDGVTFGTTNEKLCKEADMPIINEMHVTQAAEPSPPDTVPRSTPKAHRPSLLRFAWWTVPIHIALAIGFWWMMQHDLDGLASAFVWIHVGFPVLLLATARWWLARWGELLVLLLINHAATFLVLIFLPMW